MTISVNWATKIISIPKTDMTLIQSDPVEVRELNLNTFRLSLKALEDDEEGIPFLDTHRHNTEVVLGGITYARFVELINGYTVTFEDGQYVVNCIGANSNILDVTNPNQVSIRSANSAGLISSSDLALEASVQSIQSDLDDPDQYKADLSSLTVLTETVEKMLSNRLKIDEGENTLTIYENDSVTPFKVFNLKNKAGEPTSTNVYERVPQ